MSAVESHTAGSPVRWGAADSGRTWDTGTLARLSGVTSRTLRHYDAIGLLRPVAVAPGGRRLYGHEELLRLQQVLVLRELGVDLGTVARALDEGSGRRLEMLREHHERLTAERDRFDRLAATVASTIESLERGQDMAAKDLYAGFDNSQYEAEARERWGDDTVDRSNDVWGRMGPEGQAAHHAEHEAVSRGLAALSAESVPVTDERVQSLVARHHAWVSRFWTPTAEAYRGLGQMYVDDERFAATYDAFGPGLAVYLRDAIDRFAATRL